MLKKESFMNLYELLLVLPLEVSFKIQSLIWIGLVHDSFSFPIHQDSPELPLSAISAQLIKTIQKQTKDSGSGYFDIKFLHLILITEVFILAYFLRKNVFVACDTQPGSNFQFGFTFPKLKKKFFASQEFVVDN